MYSNPLLALTFFLLAPRAEGPFREMTFDQALAAAQREGKVVMIDFFTTWCGPCKKLDKITWQDPDVQKWLGEKTIPLKVDAEKQLDLAKRYVPTGYPTILFVKPDGKEIDRIVGYKAPAQFLEAAKAGLGGKDAVARAKEKLAGHEKDPMARDDYAKALEQAGRPDEALAEYLWCFDHGLENSQAYSGVRVSFLLTDIVNLGRRYPPALKALEERRDKAEAVLLSGKGAANDVKDLAALNRELGARQKTLETFDRMKKEGLLDENTKRAFLVKIAGPLVEAKRYAELVEAVGDVEAMIAERLQSVGHLEKKKEGVDEDSVKAMEQLSANMKRSAVEEASEYYEALQGAGQAEKAGRIADMLIAFDPSGRTYSTLIDRAVRAGANGAAKALADRGLVSLPEEEKKRVSQAAAKIPQPK